MDPANYRSVLDREALSVLIDIVYREGPESWSSLQDGVVGWMRRFGVDQLALMTARAGTTDSDVVEQIFEDDVYGRGFAKLETLVSQLRQLLAE